MRRVVKIPRIDQLSSFIKSCRLSDGDINRSAEFKLTFHLSDAEYELMLEQGMMNPEGDLNYMEEQMLTLVNLGYEGQIESALNKLYNQFPAATPLSFGVFLLDNGDHTRFIRKHMSGTTAFVGTDGIMRFIVAPSHRFLESLQQIVAHEYNHHLRIGACKLNNKNMTLLDVLVLEGLAEHFVETLFGSDRVGPWANVLDQDEAISLFRTKYVGKFYLPVRQTQKFVFGSHIDGIPMWAGYSIGFHIVKQFTENNQKYSLEQLSSIPSQEFVRDLMT